MVTRARRREHGILAHTADVGVTAAAADLPELFEEAARALTEVEADLGPGPQDAEPIPVRLGAPDLIGLSFAWLNELIGLADAAHAAVAATRVELVARSREAQWDLEALVWLQPFGGGLARPRLDVKSATLHRMAVDREAGGWRLVAYLDV